MFRKSQRGFWAGLTIAPLTIHFDVTTCTLSAFIAVNQIAVTTALVWGYLRRINLQMMRSRSLASLMIGGVRKKYSGQRLEMAYKFC